jgi:hypothetical protein
MIKLQFLACSQAHELNGAIEPAPTPIISPRLLNRCIDGGLRNTCAARSLIATTVTELAMLRRAHLTDES